jgi:hypothetical protein
MIKRDKMDFEEFRKKSILRRLDRTLILFELVLSVIFILLSYLTSNIYFKGVGVGLIISWVTSALAYLYRKKKVKP